MARPRGRPPKPERLAWLNGDRKRAYKVEPTPPANAPECPDWLDDLARSEWIEITNILDGMGLLSSADVTALACYCEAYSRYRKAAAAIADPDEGLVVTTKSGYQMASPWHAILRSALKDLTGFLSDFGLTPVARARLGQDRRTSTNDPAGFINLVG